MAKNRSISFNPHFENFINKLIAEGKYKNVSEVVRAGLRLLEKNEQEYRAIVEALKEAKENEEFKKPTKQ